MRKLFFLFITISFAYSLVSCKSSKATKTGNKVDECVSMIYSELPLDKIVTDSYTVDSIFITGDCLNVWVSYSGGCGYTDFSMYFTNMVLQSIPAQTTLKLKLIDKDDCRAIVQEKLYFNLNFFKDYAETDGIEIHVGGKSVMYKKYH